MGPQPAFRPEKTDRCNQGKSAPQIPCHAMWAFSGHYQHLELNPEAN